MHHRYENRHVEYIYKDYNESEWSTRNKHIQKLRSIKVSNSKMASTIAVSAVKSYLHRVAPKLTWHPENLIVGDLGSLAKYIAGSIEFVNNLVNSKRQRWPFQYDAGTQSLQFTLFNLFLVRLFSLYHVRLALLYVSSICL